MKIREPVVMLDWDNNSQAISQFIWWYPNVDVMKLVGHHEGCSVVALTQVLRKYCPRLEFILELRWCLCERVGR